MKTRQTKRIMKKTFTFIAGTLLLAPIVVALCCDNLAVISIAMVYGAILWHSPKFSPRIRRFWRLFLRINMEMSNILER